MADKLAQVREQFDRWRVDGLLITSAANRRWISGFTGSAGRVLVTRNKALLATDSRYWEQAARQAPEFEIFQLKGKPGELGDFLKAGGGVRYGVEARHVTLADMKTLRKEKDFRWKPLDQTLEAMRAIKTAEELLAIREAARITDDTVSQVPRLARVGVTEAEIAWELEKFMRESGADGPGFDIIVASGPNSALPHHHPGDRRLEAGDMIVVDLGAAVRGYRSDLTRSFYMGDSAGEDFWEIYNTVHRAQLAAIGGIKGGVTGKVVDALARDLITAAGHGDHFGHSTGHSLGLEIHEFPGFSSMAEKIIIPSGATMTVEPGIYLPGFGGVRIEDLVLVTDEGSDYLSHAPKTPLIPLT